MPHPLEPLLNPASIAVVGASERHDTPGREIMNNLLNGSFSGPLYCVNPGYSEICGLPCFARLEDLPEKVEQVYIVVGDRHVESVLEQAIAHGPRSAVIVSSLMGDGIASGLMDRIRKRANKAGLLLMGGNTMGYYNFPANVWACAFDSRANHVASGGITLITHSGSGMSGMIDCDERLDCNLAVSTGQELAVRMDQYMDYALDLPSTRVIGLFMETARDPAALRNAFRKARDKAIPVVVLKVGRTELAARLTESHSGALAGRDDAFQALFDRYGAIRVRDLDEFVTALIMFNQPHPVGAGGLVALHDSGGERQLLIDLADELELPLPALSSETVRKLEQILDPGMPAINPLDAWSAGGPDSDRVMEDSLAAMLMDEAAALGAVVHDRGPYSTIYPSYYEYMRKAHAATGKPVFLVANRQGTGSDPSVVDVSREGFPVLDGLRPFLVGVRALQTFRDFQARPAETVRPPDEGKVRGWCDRLDEPGAGGEAFALSMLEAFGIPVCTALPAASQSELIEAAMALKYPLVLKTAKEDIVHKSDVDGVVMNIANEFELRSAWADLSSRLGPRVIAMSQVSEAGVEMALGMIHDEQFGPVVMLGFGGRNIEAGKNVGFLLPPFSEKTARRLVDRLPGRILLDSHRGRGPLALDAYCQAASRFSVMTSALKDRIHEFDVNPIIVYEEGCIAVDAYVAPAAVAATGPAAINREEAE